MKTTLVLASLCVGLILAASSAHAAEDDDLSQPSGDNPTPRDTSPYGMIVSRNAFRLSSPPPPPPPPTNDTVAAAAGGLKLTGFFKLGSSPVHALFVNVPSNPTNTVYYNLTEGERDGVLELIKINEAEESAEVIHAGTRATVMLKDSKPATMGGPGGPGQPPPGVIRSGAPAPMRGGPPPMPPVVGSQSAVIGGSPGRGSGAGGVAVSGGVSTMSSGGGLPFSGGTAASTDAVIPGRTVRANPQNAGYQPQTAEESAALLYLHSQPQSGDTVPRPPMPPIPGM